MPHPDPATTSPEPGFSDFTDIDAFVRLPRVTSLTAGPDGRLVAAVQQPDDAGARLVSSLWELDPGGMRPARRLTFSEQGESSPVLTRDGDLLFTSARPDPAGEGDDEEEAAIWRLPERGEASVLAAAPGGLAIRAVADDGTVLAATSVLPGGDLDDDGERRRRRRESRNSAIWHTGMPIRAWDHELDDVSPRLVLVSPDGNLRDLAPDAETVSLRDASADLAPDGTTVATTWTTRARGGRTRTGVVLIDVATGRRTTLAPGADTHDWTAPAFSRDGRWLALTRTTTSTPTDTSYSFLEIWPLTDGDPVTVDLGDLTVSEYTWTDAGTLLVAGDLHSSGAILAFAPDGTVRTLARDAVYSALAVSGTAVFALGSDIATPPRPVRIEPENGLDLPAPGQVASLPGTLERVETEVDGATVGAWLCRPTGTNTTDPAPVMLWIHGGPHISYNAWSWRWCPWLAVARGYAVLMPDPAMSTGYGHAGLNRGWPRRADVVYRECESLLDLVLARPEFDETRTAMLGASFGGFMANWIAGHTDRFRAVVSHAGLWALEQQHRTTDAAASKMRVHPAEQAAWYETYSPDRAVASITTPMLLTHGNRDYRVPVSEALRLWWELVSRWDGDPEDLPHRFLQLTSENHWVLTPSNQVTWNETVLAFCDQHVRGGEPVPDVLPW
ncbi:prolyl oligopeptidase family serine peptidase [Georgenia deserti]|uniref:Prolyl oligopeptidase family serine peptidase n=1 Tax=Georgenia deserti TaxID=2093781 RepID=A0ABW4L1V9_9MICO